MGRKAGDGVSAVDGRFDGVGARPRRQAVHQPMLQMPIRRVEVRSERLAESFALFLLFGVAFGVLGYWMVVQHHVVPFDGLERLAGAYLAWHNDPPKLAAIGFALPPLQTIALLPFTLIRPMATSLVALPVCGAIFGGLTMVVLNRLLERCEMPRTLRYIVLLLVAAMPTTAFYAGVGGAQMISLFLLAAAMASLIAWFLTVDTRFLITSGLGFAVASMASYDAFAWMLLAAAMVATSLSRHRAGEQEIEGSVITFAAPTGYAFLLWCLCNLLIVDSPFGWISSGGSASVNATGATGAAGGGVSLLHALSSTLTLAWSAAPLVFVVAGGLIWLAFAQRNELAGWLAAFCVLAVLSPGAGAVIHNSVSSLQLSNGMPMLLVAICGAAVLYKSVVRWRPMIAGALVVGLVLSIGVVWHALRVYPQQNLEQSFRTVLSGQQPTVSRGGLAVGVGQEQAMADYIDHHIGAEKSILTDNSQTYAVILLSNRPALFSTRLDHGDGPWLSEVVTPPRAIHYLLITRNDPADALRDSYTGAVAGDRTGVRLVFADARYALLAIAPGTTLRNSRTSIDAPSVPGGLVPVNQLAGTR